MAEPVDEQSAEFHSIEELFQRLPPLSSLEYLEYVRTAPRAELPPEVLVRAFRQLPSDTPGARATLARLSNRVGDHWEYLEPLARKARRQVKNQQSRDIATDHEDLCQDAIRRVLKVLPTKRGELAERAWHTFCRNEFVDAWRERYGRRGERQEPSRGEPRGGGGDGDQGIDPLDQLSDEDSLWQRLSKQDNSKRIEEIAARVAGAMENPFVREVARAAWFSKQRPQTSGDAKAGS